MASRFEETIRSRSSESSSGNVGNDTGNFECNICFELAQEPIVTLCGHLYCWPCLYKWLHLHSQCQECPVCKALIQEEKLVPLYGRGKTPTDPRSKAVPGVNIPNRPPGQRPQTASPPNGGNFGNFAPHGFGFRGGFAPTPAMRFGNFTLSAAFGSLFPAFPPLFNVQVHGFPGSTAYGAPPASPFGFSSGFHGGHAHWFNQPANRGQQADNVLKILFFVIGVFVFFTLFFL